MLAHFPCIVPIFHTCTKDVGSPGIMHHRIKNKMLGLLSCSILSMFTRLNIYSRQACSLFEPFQLPGEHATLAAISALLGSSNHITILPLVPGTLFTAG